MMDRLFVAVDLPDEIKERIGSTQAHLKKTRARLTLVDPSIIHITLKFIGDTPEEKTEAVVHALGELDGAPFSVRVRGIAGNNPRRPRVIWARVEDGGACRDLHEKVEGILAPLGIPREGRAFTPHATVARVREFHPDLVEILTQLSGRDFGEGWIEKVFLKKSTLTSRGPLYENIGEVLLEKDSP
ncbi:MAG: RNA 2',3'-cyclic phosphodiesterase [Methanolinea sp.]|nr:RNA 2',3'-cyclic phosphodiesterase [Methanolinea sp.]